jgi:hypothetical protein
MKPLSDKAMDRIALWCGIFAILFAASIVISSCAGGPAYAPAATNNR